MNWITQEEEEYIRKAAAKGLVLNHTDDLFIPHKNRLEEDELEGTGLDAAVDLLTEAVSGKASVDEHPERRRKVYLIYCLRCMYTSTSFANDWRTHFPSKFCVHYVIGSVQCLL